MPTVKDAAGNVQSVPDALCSLPYSASITPAHASASVFSIVVTNGSALTINAPTLGLVPGRIITFDILNSSGGAMGAITWDAVFKKGAFTVPANTKRSTIQFYFDGTNWVALNAQSLDS